MNDVIRKLASVRKIASVEAIPDADNIVCATVDGWKLVTQKSNNFQAVDLVVYFEIDSFLPMTERFEFLRKSSYKVMDNVEGFRLKTIKLRGQVSQGLILPLSEFADHGQMEEGDDLTEVLGIKKWEAPLHPSLAGKARGNFPEFIRKTDQERVQNVFKYFSRYKKTSSRYEMTLKLDGSSTTIYCKSGYVGVCSRNLDLTETEENAFWKVARSTNLISALESYGRNIAIQGELMGPGVQGNRENLKALDLYVFDIFDIDKQEYMDYEERKSVIGNLISLNASFKEAPNLGIIDINDIESVQQMLDMADRPSISHPIAEGIVFKSLTNPRHSFKVINNKFLLKEKD